MKKQNKIGTQIVAALLIYVVSATIVTFIMDGFLKFDKILIKEEVNQFDKILKNVETLIRNNDLRAKIYPLSYRDENLNTTIYYYVKENIMRDLNFNWEEIYPLFCKNQKICGIIFRERREDNFEEQKV